MSAAHTCAVHGTPAASTDNPFWWVCSASCVTDPIGVPGDGDGGQLLVRFFVAAGHSISEEQQAQCQACPVRMQCLQWAVDEEIDFGFYGGLSPTTRASVPFDVLRGQIEAGII